MQAGVEALYDEGDDNAAHQEEERRGKDKGSGGADGWTDGRQGYVHLVDLGGAQTGLDLGGFKTLLERVVQGAVLLILALEQGVAHHLIALAVGLCLLRVEFLLGGALGLLRGEIDLAGLGFEAAALVVELLYDLVDLGPQLFHARKIRAQGFAELGILRPVAGKPAAQSVPLRGHGAGRDLNGPLKRGRVHILDHEVALLGVDARDLGCALGGEELVKRGLGL